MRDEVDEILAESTSLIAENQARLKAAMEQHTDWNQRQADWAIKLAGAAVRLGNEARKHYGSIELAARKTSMEQRADIAEQWLAKLPNDLLRPVLERLVKRMKERQAT